MQKEKILIIHKGHFDNFPPLMSVKSALNNSGYNVDVLTCKLKNDKLFKNGETCFVIKNSKKIPIITNFIWYFRYTLKAIVLLNKSEYRYFWVEGGDTLALFGWIFKKKKNTIFQLSELYDKIPRYKFLIGLYIKKFSRVVVPEINRAYIIKTRYNLMELPAVLPNKPNYIVSDTLFEDSINEVVKKITAFSKHRRIILYQGLIANDRRFDGVIDFVKEHKSEYCIILLGPDQGYLKIINNDSDAIYYAGFVYPPNHLEVTKLAWVCIMAYDTTSLNKVYCAPNKIWEYTRFSKPIISQDLPGIKMLFNEYGIGISCDLLNKVEVQSAIEKIGIEYDRMVINTRDFYDSVNIDTIVESILNK